ncbi:MAG: hypothetical protein DMF92_18575, partial [Acidobacteria bacterium]
ILAALVATAITSCNMRQALALDVPPPLEAVAQIDFFQEARIGKLPGVEDVRGRELRAMARRRHQEAKNAI